MQLLNVSGDPSGCTTQIEIGKVGGIERKGAIRDLQRLLEVVKPDRVSILSQGRIVRTGGPELAVELENEGYDAIMSAETAHA